MKLPRHNLIMSLLLALAVAFAPLAGAVAAVEMLPLGQETPCHHMAEDTGESSKHNCCDHHACQEDCSHCGQCLSVFVFGPVVRPLELDDFHAAHDSISQAMASTLAVAGLFRPPQQFS